MTKEQTKKTWHHYEPSTKEKEKMMYSRRSYAEHLESLDYVIYPLTKVSQDINRNFDEYFFEENAEKIHIRIYGSEKHFVANPRIEFLCEPSRKNEVNLLIDKLKL